VYKSGVTFRGDAARWLIWELVMKGHDLLWISDVFGKNSWNALYIEQEKAGLTRGDIGPKTIAIFKPEGSPEMIELKKLTLEFMSTMTGLIQDYTEKYLS
jgi:hypothetical protein